MLYNHELFNTIFYNDKFFFYYIADVYHLMVNHYYYYYRYHDTRHDIFQLMYIVICDIRKNCVDFKYLLSLSVLKTYVTRRFYTIF